MLAADIAGGSFPAVINILLALRARDQSGQGCRIDIAMTDAMFTFAWAALALGAATGRFPKPGELWLVGGSPRYQIYPAKDGKLVACGAIEQKFWVAFTKAIPCRRNSSTTCAIPRATRDAVAKLIAARSSDEWRPIFAAADCCTTIVAPLEEAMHDPHFVGRGLFAHKVATASGKSLPALPLPIAPEFRETPGVKKAPKLYIDLLRRDTNLQSVSAHQPRLCRARRYSLAHHRAPQRSDAVDQVKTQPAHALHRQEIARAACG